MRGGPRGSSRAYATPISGSLPTEKHDWLPSAWHFVLKVDDAGQYHHADLPAQVRAQDRQLSRQASRLWRALVRRDSSREGQVDPGCAGRTAADGSSPGRP